MDSLLLLRNSQIYTADSEVGIIEDGAIAIKDGVIQWIGDDKALPSEFIDNATQSINFEDGWVTPGLIDCHTHLVYGGNRSDEFRRQLEGETYQQISASGGGILATVKATREASEESLYQTAFKRMQNWLAQGVTHIEIKSGYGLDLVNELKMLRVAKRLEDKLPISVSKTLLAAHALPPEFKEDDWELENAKEKYIGYICHEIIPEAINQDLVDAVDGFCESIAFTTEQIATLFDCCEKNQLPVKLHAEQLTNQQGSLLAAQYSALSADHLEYLDEQSVIAMAEANTVAVLLPAAFYFLQETKLPPVELLRKHGVPIAIATDHNPGSAPVESLPLMLNMACRLFGLTPSEALLGVTANAAKALGVFDNIGSLTAGKRADILHWPIFELDDLCYYFGAHRPDFIVKDGIIR